MPKPDASSLALIHKLRDRATTATITESNSSSRQTESKLSALTTPGDALCGMWPTDRWLPNWRSFKRTPNSTTAYRALASRSRGDIILGGGVEDGRITIRRLSEFHQSEPSLFNGRNLGANFGRLLMVRSRQTLGTKVNTCLYSDACMVSSTSNDPETHWRPCKQRNSHSQ